MSPVVLVVAFKALSGVFNSLLPLVLREDGNFLRADQLEASADRVGLWLTLLSAANILAPSWLKTRAVLTACVALSWAAGLSLLFLTDDVALDRVLLASQLALAPVAYALTSWSLVANVPLSRYKLLATVCTQCVCLCVCVCVCVGARARNSTTEPHCL